MYSIVQQQNSGQVLDFSPAVFSCVVLPLASPGVQDQIRVPGVLDQPIGL